MNISIKNEKFRKDAKSLEALFGKSGIMQAGGNEHSNIMVIEDIDGAPCFSVPASVAEVEAMDDQTVVIVRWPGKFRSDCFQFRLWDWFAWKTQKEGAV